MNQVTKGTLEKGNVIKIPGRIGYHRVEEVDDAAEMVYVFNQQGVKIPIPWAVVIPIVIEQAKPWILRLIEGWLNKLSVKFGAPD